MDYVFYILAIWIVGSGLLAILQRNLVHCAVALIAFFAGIAGIFFSLHAEFLGAIQVVVYVGAIAVLILFAIMLTRHVTGEEEVSPFSRHAIWGWIASAAVLCVLLYSLDKQMFAISAEPSQITMLDIGNAMMQRYAVPFEVISLLLTAALVGAVVIALEEPRERK